MQKLKELVSLARCAQADDWSGQVISPETIFAIAGHVRELEQEAQKNLEGAFAWQQRAEAAEAKLADEKQINSKLRDDRAVLSRECNEFEAKLAELNKQEPVLYALKFKNSNGKPERLINDNCLFRHREDAEKYGLGGNYVTQENGKIEWVANPSLNPEVIPLFTRPAPAVNLADLVPECFTQLHKEIGSRHNGRMPKEVQDAFDECTAILRKIEEAKK
jgi:hypothetical protein